jgi:adenylylsulfate kinase-like enzyme
MIYWFTGNSDSNTKLFANKLKDFLETEKRNWRKDVYIIEDNDVFADDESAQVISNFINKKGGDVVVYLESPNRETLNQFKDLIDTKIIEINVYNSRKRNKEKVNKSDIPQINFFDMDTCSENTNQSFSKLINYLKAIEKI